MAYDDRGNRITASAEDGGFIKIDFSKFKGGWADDDSITDLSQPGNETNDSGSSASADDWDEALRNLPESDPPTSPVDLRRQKRVLDVVENMDIVDEAKAYRFDRDRDPFVEPPMFMFPELRLRPRTSPEYKIADLWPEGGNVLFAAPAKFGKSTVVMNLVRALLDGTPFLGFFKCPKMAADETLLLIDLEMSETRVVDELEAQQIKDGDRLGVAPLRGDAKSFDVTNPEVRAHWVKVCLENNVKTLILDPLAPLLGHLGIDENDNSLINRFFQQLDSFKKDAGIRDMMVVHHCGHSADWRPRGASRFNDWPDSLWLAKINGPVNDPASPREFFARGRDIWQSLSGEGTITPDVSNPKKLTFDTQSSSAQLVVDGIRGAIDAQVFSSQWYNHEGNTHKEIVDKAHNFVVATNPDIKRNKVDEMAEQMRDERGDSATIHGHEFNAPGKSGRAPWRLYPADTCPHCKV